MIDRMTSDKSVQQPSSREAQLREIYDPCYEIRPLVMADSFRIAPVDSPYSAPSHIVRQILKADLEFDARAASAVHAAFADGKLLPIKFGNRLLHPLGAWHFAEECLELGRIRYRRQQEPKELRVESLANRLVYGKGQNDTMFEEFCLAAFFQAYLDHLPEVGCDRPDDIKGNPDGTKTVIETELKKSIAYRDQKERIQTHVIAYWVSGKGEPPAPDRAPEEIRDDPRKSHYSFFMEAEMVKRIRWLFFAPDAPLNLRHLDLLSRMCASSDHPTKPRRYNQIVRDFLSRILLAPRGDGQAHLLPDESTKAAKSAPKRDTDRDWTLRCPYYVPQTGDDPAFRFLKPFLEELGKVQKQRRNGDARCDHSLFKAYSAANIHGLRTGLLRLSLWPDSHFFISNRGWNFWDYMSKITDE